MTCKSANIRVLVEHRVSSKSAKTRQIKEEKIRERYSVKVF